MNKLQKMLGVGALALSLTGCAGPPEFLEGIVVAEEIETGSRIDYANFGYFQLPYRVVYQNYTLTVDTERGRYVMRVVDHPKKRVDALKEEIEEGDKIRFPTKGQSYFNKNRVGSVVSHDIRLVEKAKK